MNILTHVEIHEKDGNRDPITRVRGIVDICPVCKAYSRLAEAPPEKPRRIASAAVCGTILRIDAAHPIFSAQQTHNPAETDIKKTFCALSSDAGTDLNITGIKLAIPPRATVDIRKGCIV
jgi:hypothetical protein